MGMFYRTKTENERYAKQIRNSAGIAVFVSGASDRAHWVEAGHQCRQPAGIATQPIEESGATGAAPRRTLETRRIGRYKF